ELNKQLDSKKGELTKAQDKYKAACNGSAPEMQDCKKAEDTAAGLATEGTLKDTVEWVESTSTQIDGGYVKVDKASVMNPAKVTPTVKVSELGVTRGVLAQRFMTSKRILVASEEVEKTEEPAPSGEVDPSNTETDDSDNDPAPSNTPAASETAPDEPIVSPVETPAVSPTEAPEEAPEEKPEAIASPTPSPKVDPKEDTTTPLTDTKGNKLYLKTKDGEFIEAKAADYYKEGLVYYRKAAEGENAKYTGWQTLKGETYFFDKNGNFVTGEQIIQGAKYTFDSKGALVKGSGVMGIDVSKWNGNINWTAVKNSGVSFVIIRCGYRGSSTGALVEDPKFRTNIKGATDAGLKVGIYFFSQAITDVEAVEEASMTIDLIKSYKISYPVFLDVEDSNGRGDRIDAGTRTAVIQAFCQTMKNSGYTAGVYANKSWLTSKMNVGSLGNFKIWLAQYNTEVTYTGRYDLWQYSSKGSVGGISGNTDMNLSYLGY
ncbi:MAG: hypothetical protein MJ150_06675, partial [Clostridia bacterium]|nr:hypothetical protein [Clostridia bacterium]